MLTIALVSQKGGAGKTTIAVGLAVAHELAGGGAAVVDLDPQGSASSGAIYAQLNGPWWSAPMHRASAACLMLPAPAGSASW